MSRSIHGIFQVIYIQGLVFCLAGLISGTGCSKGFLEKRPTHEKQWACDKAVDEPMKQHDYGKAILLHQSFLRKEPANGLALYHLGYAYGQTGDHQKEALYYEQAIDLGFKEDSLFFNLGMAYGELNQIENSIDAFNKALNINPNSADNHFGLALAYQRSVADKMAAEEFLKAIEIDPTHLDSRLHLSLLYADMGDMQKACNQLRKILEINPAHRGAHEFLKRIEKE
ncbi:MAG: tetratricopeptide repeat protein [Deltaproteobacteria bacterium]|nr:tetratricopeptide repeat protein [Deltaproteobacteria bacterium]